MIELKTNPDHLHAEINMLRTQRDDTAKHLAALLAIFRPELERMIEAAVESSSSIEDLADRVEALESDREDIMRDTVRDMIRGGDIIVRIDLS